MTPPSAPRLIKLLAAYSPQEALRYRLVLEGAGVAFTVRNELTQNLFGGGAIWDSVNPAVGPIEFWVPAAAHAAALAALADSFEIRPEAVPETCPACHGANPRRLLDCPHCGLFLG